jgi:hypothetical protein
MDRGWARNASKRKRFNRRAKEKEKRINLDAAAAATRMLRTCAMRNIYRCLA